jgi:hypothetical protein
MYDGILVDVAFAPFFLSKASVRIDGHYWLYLANELLMFLVARQAKLFG